MAKTIGGIERLCDPDPLRGASNTSERIGSWCFHIQVAPIQMGLQKAQTGGSFAWPGKRMGSLGVNS
jgi:hypothetical protein